MYDGCFGLTHRPFAPVPRMDLYFAAGTIEAARTTLARCIERAEGAGFVVGPSGTGKTLLCLMLAEQFRQSLQVAMLASGRLGTRRSLFQAILYELGRPYRYMDEGELRLAIVEHLTENGDGSRGMLLLVDEAHTLPPRLLDEIRLLSNLAQDGRPLVRLVLAGGPALEERFACPKLDSFSQRLSARCYLESFNRTETQEYVRWQIDASGGAGAEMFPEDACHSIFQATGGVPRLINQLCDHAMLLADVSGRLIVTPSVVDEAWADLQQLPTPWSCESQNELPENGVIEFGALDDAPEPCAGASDGSSAMARVLRVAAVEEEEDAKPEQQIHRIERLLAEADDDFHPAGSIHPEIELRFEDSLHPFQEDFEHEEVVSDRYAAIARKNPEFAAPVFEQPSSLPAAKERFDAEIPVAVAEENSEEFLPSDAADENREEVEIVDEEIEKTEEVECAARESLPSPAAGSGIESDDSPRSESEILLEQPDEPTYASTMESSVAFSSTVVPARPEGSLATAIAGDGFETPITHRPAPSEPIQRREYRQLFARLLQG